MEGASPYLELPFSFSDLSVTQRNTGAALPLQAVLVSIVMHALWGGNPVAVKFGLLVFPPMWSAFIRFVIGIACIVAWAAFRGIPMWPKRGEWRLLMLLGALFVIQMSTLNIGFDLTKGSIAAILISTNPLFAAIAAHFVVVNDRLSVRKGVGLMIAFGGVVIVLLGGFSLKNLSVIGVGGLVVLLSSVLLGMRLVFMARVQKKISGIRVVLWQMILSLPIFAFLGVAFETINWENLAFGPIAGLLYQGVVIAGVGFMVISYLLSRYPPSVIASFNFVSPVSGVLLSALLLGDQITPTIIGGVICVGVGLYFVSRPKKA
jgi:drug/metabolite transporter (DMT)-like permease